MHGPDAAASCGLDTTYDMRSSLDRVAREGCLKTVATAGGPADTAPYSDGSGGAVHSGAPHIGRALSRFEDRRLLSGGGRYTDDFNVPGQLWAAFVRSPYPSARIGEIDTNAARAMPGVRAVLTGADYRAEGGKPLLHFADPADARDHTRRAFGGHPGNLAVDRPHWPLPTDRVRHVGEPVALVVADSHAEALDAAEAVAIDWQELPHVVSARAALAPGAPQVDPDVPGNLCVDARFGDIGAAEAVIAAAPFVVEQEFPNQRIANAQMEPRSVIVSYDAEAGVYRMIAGSQGAVRQRDTLAAALGTAPGRVEVICPDVGGGFGPRTNMSPEQPALAIAARLTGRPIRWTSTRSEAFLTDYQGRDLIIRARMGFDHDGRILGYRAEILGNVGAYTVAFVPMANSFRILTTVYDVPVAGVSVRGALTHTAPTAPYRGAGRPEATFAMERMLDIAARRLGIDRIDLRRRNLIRRAAMPYCSAMGLVYDSGDFTANMNRALHDADWAGFPARRHAARARGRLAGIGLANYVESPVGIPHERIDIAVRPEGVVEVVTGTQSTGQGHETSFAQVIADRLGVRPEEVRLISGDTRRVVSGGGTHSDRSMRLGGALLVQASADVVARACAVLAHLRGCAPDQVRFTGGLFLDTATNEGVDIFSVARLSEAGDLPDDLRGPLFASASFTGRMPAYPTGSAVCEVEVDPETGAVEVAHYTSIDDAGQPINPMILHGQVHGGIVQGLGQALSEAMISDPGSGQILTGSYMDYGMLRADALPRFAVDLVEDPTEGNPLRVKGGGESGITPALATAINAVCDALAERGVDHIDMPATPARIWAALQAAGATQGGRNDAG